MKSGTNQIGADQFKAEPVSVYGCMRGSTIIKGNLIESTGEQWEAEA